MRVLSMNTQCQPIIGPSASVPLFLSAAVTAHSDLLRRHHFHRGRMSRIGYDGSNRPVHILRIMYIMLNYMQMAQHSHSACAPYPSSLPRPPVDLTNP